MSLWLQNPSFKSLSGTSKFLLSQFTDLNLPFNIIKSLSLRKPRSWSRPPDEYFSSFSPHSLELPQKRKFNNHEKILNLTVNQLFYKLLTFIVASNIIKTPLKCLCNTYFFWSIQCLNSFPSRHYFAALSLISLGHIAEQKSYEWRFSGDIWTIQFSLW